MDPKFTAGQEYITETKSADEDLQPEKRHSLTGDVFVNDHGAETDLRRILSTRHLTMIALGSSIGMGCEHGPLKILDVVTMFNELTPIQYGSDPVLP
jgi:amino acid permease